MRINAVTALSGESVSRRHKKTSGFSAATPACASSLRLKSLRFQVMIVTMSALDRLRAATAAAAAAAWSITDSVALRDRREFLECRLPLRIPCALVLEHSNPSDPAMTADLG